MAIVINGSGTVTGLAVGGLPDGTVDSGTLASNAVTEAKIASSAVVTAKLNDDAVTNAKIANDAITEHELAGSAVVTAAINDDAITAAKLASGTVVQAKSVGYTSSSAVSVAAPSGSADLMSTTMTVQANSKVMMWFDSHQTSLSQTNCNPNVYFNVDGSNVSPGTNHYFYQHGGRTVINIMCLTGTLSAGSHTFKIIGRAYNGTVTYNYQDNNGGIFMLQEIKG